MTMLRRYDPLRDTVPLVQAVNRLFEDSFVRPNGWMGVGVPVDVEETEDAYVVTANLPGWKPEEVDLSIQNGTLTISGQREAAGEPEPKRTYHLRERSFASFRRSISFAQMVDADKAQAAYEHGVLTLTLPKAESARPRKIQIGANGQRQISAGKSK